MTTVRKALMPDFGPRYCAERELGRGGMAIVYLARDVRHERHVAVKLLRPELAAHVGTERFLREIRITADLAHPNILPLLDSGELDGVPYYVMPYVEGESLRERMLREKHLPIDEAVRIAREVADALSCAHDRGFLHRDVKPENILLSRGHAVLADFGIAQAVSVATGNRLTATGMAMGTSVYMSPERMSGEGGGPDGDVYALGCVLYEMLVGEPPFTGPTPNAVLARKSIGAVPGLRVVRDTVPAHLEATVIKALARIPADRFATAQDFAAALERKQEPTRAASAQGRQRQVARAGTTLVVVMATGLAGWYIVGAVGTSPTGVTSTPQRGVPHAPQDVNPAAYEAWLRGMQQSSRLTGESVEACIRSAREATRIDPRYAAAYVLLARCYNTRTFLATSPPDASVGLAKEAARTALTLDSALAEAHLALGWALAVGDWDWAAAESSFQRSLRLDPDHAGAHANYSFFLSWMGDFKGAIEHAREAVQLNQLSAAARSNLSVVLYLARRYDEAITEGMSALEADADFMFGYQRLGVAYAAKGMFTESLAAAERAASLSGPRDMRRKASLAYTHARAGRLAQARDTLTRLLELERTTYVPPLAIAMVYVGLGDSERALHWVERGFDGRDGDMVLLKSWPLWDPLRSSPRFQELERKMKFPRS